MRLRASEIRPGLGDWLEEDASYGAIVLPWATVSAAQETVCSVAPRVNRLNIFVAGKRKTDDATEYAATIGAVLYVLWGIFHLVAANAVYALAERSAGMVCARLLQDAFYLLFFAVAGIVIAVILNWRNDTQG
jgi:hypothetical protein